MKKLLISILKHIVALSVMFTVLSIKLTPFKPEFKWLEPIQYFALGIIAYNIYLLVQKQLFH